ncbi:phage portal protein [Rahnella aquatilis]|nr:phage portal protein [Rahnella aquatilis]
MDEIKFSGPNKPWLDTEKLNGLEAGSNLVAQSGGQQVTEFSAITFDDPEPLRGWSDFLDCMECAQNGMYYETPISFYELGRLFSVAVHHQSPLYFKRNVIMSCFKPHPLLSRKDAGAVVLDYLTFGNGYLELRKNRLGQPLELRHVPAKYTRRGVNLNQFWYVQRDAQDYAFEPGSVCQIMNPEIHQEIYGLPEYLAMIMSAYLNNEATKFRRNYYINGSHAGKLIYLSDAIANPKQVESLKKALTGARGNGAFKNLFVYAAGGKKDGIQVMPFSDITAKDDFSGIKNITQADMLAAHRVPPQLMGIIPNNAAGFGDVEKAAKVFAINELYPVMESLKHLNDWLGIEVFTFNPYALAEGAQ